MSFFKVHIMHESLCEQKYYSLLKKQFIEYKDLIFTKYKDKKVRFTAQFITEYNDELVQLAKSDPDYDYDGYEGLVQSSTVMIVDEVILHNSSFYIEVDDYDGWIKLEHIELIKE